jgi:hypothetical protein
MSTDSPAKTSSRKLWWTSRVIDALVIAWFIGSARQLRDRSVELSLSVEILGAVAVFWLA